MNLFHSDPALHRRGVAGDYERAADTLAALAGADTVVVLHALLTGEDTVQRAAVWAGLSQTTVEGELASLCDAGLVARGEDAVPSYAVRDGHVVVLTYLLLAHGREAARAPRLLRSRRARAVMRRAG